MNISLNRELLRTFNSRLISYLVSISEEAHLQLVSQRELSREE